MAGYCIALKSYLGLKHDVAEGGLHEVLRDYAYAGNSINVVYQVGKTMPKSVRALIEALVASFLVDS